MESVDVITPIMNELEALVSTYGIEKGEYDKLKKSVDGLNTRIKELLKEIGEDTFSAGGYTVTRGVQHRESLDEEKLIKKLKKFAPDTECIKTKEYIDMDVLENEIYHGLLSDDAMLSMDECRNVKEVVTLTIKKDKKGKK